MSELQNKSQAWKDYKAICAQYNIRPQIRYQTSNSTEIQAEIRNLRTNPPQIQPQQPQRKYKNKTRPQLLRELRAINPNTAFNYQRSTIDSLYREIHRENIRRNINNLTNNALDRFMRNPVNGNSFEVDTNQLMSIKNSLRLENNFYLELHFTINGQDTYRVLSNIDEVHEVLRLISEGYQVQQPEQYGSDPSDIVEMFEYGGTLEMTWFDKRFYNKTNGGAYFKWFHKFTTYNKEQNKYEVNLDLSKYQVYSQNQKVNNESCIIYALRQAGLNENKLNEIQLAIFEKHVLFRDLKTICKIGNFTINLTPYNEERKQTRPQIINKGTDTVFEIGVVDEHYFVNELTDITASAITYFYETKDSEFYPSVYLKSPRHTPKQDDKFLTSFEVIRNIYKQRNKWLTLITLTNAPSNSTEKLDSYYTLKAPRKAPCKCEIDEYVDCWFPKEHKRNKDHQCNHELCRLNTLNEHCECDSKKFNQYKDYSRLGQKSIFKGKFNKYNPNNDYDLIFLDLETFIRTKEGYHIPYCLSYQYEFDNNKYYFYGLNSVKQFLDSLKRNAVIITHNLAFDFRGFIDHLTKLGAPIETGTRLKHIQCKYNYNHLVFKDNMAFLPFPLRQLPKMFKLQSGDKDIYPYEVINEDNLESLIDIKECKKYISPKDHKTFELNCKKVGALIGDKVDIKAYTIYYCNQDVSILKQAYLEFRRQIKKITNLDIITLISLPQLADDFFKSEGAYDSCYSISGVSQDFIRKCAVGGRVMCNKNKKWNIKHDSKTPPLSKAAKMNKMSKEFISCKRISDFDAVSLYPSAMVRLDGYLRGLPKLLTEWDIRNFTTDNFDYYFAEIEILSVGKHREFPLISNKEDSGVRNFTNDLIGKTFHVDKTTLQDLVNFQSITYKVIRGYKYTDGFNTKIINVIHNMFNERMKLKKEVMPDGSKGNPLQQAYKLILNASYGKLIQKPIKTEKVFVKGNYRNYVIRNAKIIDSYARINEDLILIKKKKSVIKHFTACHLACQVLSMSKRIMNEVMCLAEDENIKIFYQDTDSMHLYDKNVEHLANAFKLKYNRELIGKAMGQFHTDFGILNEDGEEEVNVDENYPITAIESMFLGKKTYIDKLEYKDKEGNIKYYYHIRAKGLPLKVIKNLTCNVISFNSTDSSNPIIDGVANSKTYENVMDMYNDLYNEVCLEFDLAEICCIKIEKNYRATKTKKFIRKAHFLNQ